MNLTYKVPRRQKSESQIIAVPAYTVAPPVQASVASDFREFLCRNYKLLALTTFLGLVVAYVVTSSQTPHYRATATIEIQDLNESYLNLRDNVPSSPLAQISAANDMQTQLRLLQSVSLVGRALAGVPAEKIPPPRGAAVLSDPILVINGPVAPPSEEDRAETRLERALQNLQVRETRQARIVDVVYDSPDPVYAAAFANTLVQQYIDQSINNRLEISRVTSEWLEKQLGDVRGKMSDSEHRLQEYATKAGLFVTTEEHRPDEEKFRQVQENLTKAQENRMVKQARMETAAAAPLDSLEVPIGSALRDYQTKLADLRRQRADLVTVLTPDFEGVKRLDAQISALETTLRTETSALLQNIKNEYADSLRRENLIEQSYTDQIGKVNEQAGIAIQYGILKRDVETNRVLYNTMLQRTAEAKVASALKASGARMVDAAKAPRKPYRPSRILNLMWGGTAGMLLGLVLVTFRPKPEAKQFAPQELAFQFGVPQLGKVPRLAIAAQNGSDRRRFESGYVRIRGQESGSGTNAAMVTWDYRSSKEASWFRSILASILLTRQTDRTPQVIVVTSAVEGEGKTTLVTNLAAALAQMGRSVLLVDASPNRGLLRLYKEARDFGLLDVVEMPGDNSSLLAYVTHKTPWPGVSLVATGQKDTHAADLHFAPGMPGIVHEMRRTYDVVLIDAPSLEELPDARFLGKMADGVVMVIQPGAGKMESALAAIEQLRADGTVVLGTVFNQAS